MTRLRWLLAIGVAMALAPGSLGAQQAATVSGRVTSETGAPVVNASVYIPSLSVGAVTRADGSYTLTVPASRIGGGRQVQLTVQTVGYKRADRIINLASAARLTADFQLQTDVLQLEGIVAVGQGITQERRAVAASINSVEADEIVQSRETNLVAAMAGKAPNVEITSSSGDAGVGAYIRIRGSKTLQGDGQPLFVVDGVPIDNSSINIEDAEAGTSVQNRASDINPQDIEDVQILKGAAAAAIYGSRAANGVVLITTKSGRPGQTRATYTTTYTNDEVNEFVPLQRSFGRGVVNLTDPTKNDSPNNVRSWGPALAPGTPTFDHASELFGTGETFENTLALSGGSDRTTYFLSVGNTTQQGVLKAGSEFDRTTVRLKGDHRFTDVLKIGGNFAYAASGGDYVQTGSNISGVQLGALRTPPEFNNCRNDEGYRCYLAPNGLPFSYRTPSPSNLLSGQGFDNPFFVLNEHQNTTDVSRYFGNINIDFQPLNWLNVSYIVGADYANDERLTKLPKGSSDYPLGRMIRADLVTEQYDSNLLLTANYAFQEFLHGTLTLGQNLNQREYSRFQVNGQNLILGTDQLDFTVDKTPNEYREKVRTDGYFVQLTTDLWDQLFLTGALRWDASSTFGESDNRYMYPKFSAAYDFSELLGLSRYLDFGKLRFAYGVAGVQPTVYSNVSSFGTGRFFDGWVFDNGLYSIYGGNEGVFTNATQGNLNIKPEKTYEREGGIDLAFLDNRVSLGLTYYSQTTTDAILEVSVPPSTGYTSRWANAAEFTNRGWEATLDLAPVRDERFGWDVALQYARNKSCVRSLAGTEEYSLNGFTGSTSSVVAPLLDENGNIEKCYQYGVFYTDDFLRFGRGSISDQGVDIDAAFPGVPAGTLFIGPDGFPQYDGQLRVTGDPNPDWTGSIRNTFTLFKKLRVSGLLDIKYGGEMWNGTRGALYSYGTHKDTEPWHGLGKDTVFPGEGPGKGTPVTLNWQTWGRDGMGNGFNGPASQFIEDAGYVKLRDVSLSYTLDQPWLKRLGINSAEVTVAGRNLKTWTNYTGIDPESNLTGQSLGRGLDYFNNPRTRSYVFTMTLNH